MYTEERDMVRATYRGIDYVYRAERYGESYIQRYRVCIQRREIW